VRTESSIEGLLEPTPEGTRSAAVSTDTRAGLSVSMVYWLVLVVVLVKGDNLSAPPGPTLEVVVFKDSKLPELTVAVGELVSEDWVESCLVLSLPRSRFSTRALFDRL
jgi:hypothetical protein